MVLRGQGMIEVLLLAVEEEEGWVGNVQRWICLSTTNKERGGVGTKLGKQTDLCRVLGGGGEGLSLNLVSSLVPVQFVHEKKECF